MDESDKIRPLLFVVSADSNPPSTREVSPTNDEQNKRDQFYADGQQLYLPVNFDKIFVSDDSAHNPDQAHYHRRAHQGDKDTKVHRVYYVVLYVGQVSERSSRLPRLKACQDSQEWDNHAAACQIVFHAATLVL